MKLAVISPYTHLNGHYWGYTADLLSAISSADADFSVYASRQPRYLPADCPAAMKWHACCPWTRILLSEQYRARNWGSRPEAMIRNLEFYLCLRKAMQSAERDKSNPAHIHCIEARHRILLHAVLHSNLSFSSLCVGEPNTPMGLEMAENYKRAFSTGRLTFFVETEAVARAWKEVAGEHVIHIPAALPWVKHQPMHQAEARKRLNLPESAFICLFFGTHREGKDYRLAIEAAKRSNSKPYLWFVGPLISGNDPDALLSELGYPDASSRKGYLPDEDVPAVFDACDAVMLPYADNYVKGSAVLLQACHFKKPVIATHTGHLRDYVLENENGLLFDTGSIESLAACYDELGTLKANHRLNQRFDYTRSHSNYSWNTLIGSYLKVFFK